MKYSIIYADPPWEYKDKRNNDPKFGAMTYKTMKLNDIKGLKINTISNKDCMLFIWVTFPLLVEGLEVINHWGFKYKTLAFSWIKTNRRQNLKQMSFLPSNPDLFFGIGYYTKSNCEVCLLGTKGKPIKISNNVSSVIISKIRGHSKKPKEVRQRIVKLCGDIPRIELFAREKTKGWDAWGNEIDSDINL